MRIFHKNNQMRREMRAKNEPKSVYSLLCSIEWAKENEKEKAEVI